MVRLSAKEMALLNEAIDCVIDLKVRRLFLTKESRNLNKAKNIKSQTTKLNQLKKLKLKLNSNELKKNKQAE